MTGSVNAEWHYPPGQYEAGLIHHLVRTGRAAVRFVAFTDNYARTADSADFRLPEGCTLRHATGTVTHEPDGTIRVQTEAGTPPAVVVVDLAEPILARVAGADWAPARVVRAPTERPPDEAPEPVHRIPLAYRDGLWSSPTPLLGHPCFRCAVEPGILSGESRA